MIRCLYGCEIGKFDGCCNLCPHQPCEHDCLEFKEACGNAVSDEGEKEELTVPEAVPAGNLLAAEVQTEDDLIIDPEFNLLPGLMEEEFQQLDTNLVNDGVRDPIVVWGRIIIDGGNRYLIARRRGLPYQVVHMDFASAEEAKQWIRDNQLGRRNLPTAARIKLALEKEPELRELAKTHQLSNLNHQNLVYQYIGKRGFQDENQYENIPQTVDEPNVKGEYSIHTVKELAKISGASHETVRRYKYLQARASPELMEAVDKGEKSIGGAFEEQKAIEANVDKFRPTESFDMDYYRQKHKAVIEHCYRQLYKLRKECKELWIIKSNKNTAADMLHNDSLKLESLNKRF